MQKIKLGIIDESKWLCANFTTIVKHDPQIDIVFQGEKYELLFQFLKTFSLDIVVWNSSLNIDQTNGLKRLTKNYPSIKIIAWLKNVKETDVVELIIHGIHNFVDENHKWEEGDFGKAARLVNEGGIYMTEYSAQIIQHYLLKTYNQLKPPPVSSQEKELIKMIMGGMTSKQIGERLYKSHRTVDDMREKLYRKFEVTNKVELIRVAMQYGLQQE
jgi:two-component system, NarL family, response regulator NreC